MRLPIAALILILASSAAHADTIAGRASVIDGDTLEIHGERIRILDIDAPESRQACQDQDGNAWRCGQQAAIALADWIGQQPVTCETTKKDRYKRWLARCSVGSVDLATWLAGHGWAVPYRDCKCDVVRDAADMARLERVVIWSGTFTLPWEWRKAH
jgi:endonuclease YncB( thermonuclease family)